MVWIKAFQHFDPFDPAHLHLPGYGLVVERALPLLKNRSRAELEYALSTLATMHGTYDMSFLTNTIREMEGPDGHFNFPHPWPGQIPPAD